MIQYFFIRETIAIDSEQYLCLFNYWYWYCQSISECIGSITIDQYIDMYPIGIAIANIFQVNILLVLALINGFHW